MISRIVNSSILPIIIKKIRVYFVKKWRLLKSNPSRPYIEELTVFIRVKIDNLKDISLLMPEIVRNKDKILKEIINITTDKKYLCKSSVLK